MEPEGAEHGFKPVETDPVPVFENLSGNVWDEEWSFAGWYTIDRVQYLRPYSGEQKRMLKQKYNKVDANGKVKRQAKARKYAVSCRWAVLKFVKDEAVPEERGVPTLPNFGKKHTKVKAKTASKTINEILQEMRSGNADTAPSEHSGDGRQGLTPLAEQNPNMPRSDRDEETNIDSRSNDRQQLLKHTERWTRSGKRYGGGEVIVS